MKHGSLFSGIGGFDLAAEWMGWENIFHCEINEFCQKVLKYHFPKSIGYNDITKTDFTIHRGKIDILTGGFPCQPYSMAGKRKGKEDDRHLWPQMLRAVREIQPRWVVGENVFGLVNWSRGLVFHEVQTDLEVEGYEVFPYVLPACAKDAPHRRDRVWFVAYATNIDASRCGRNGSDRQSIDTGERQGVRGKLRNISQQTASPHSTDTGIEGMRPERENEIHGLGDVADTATIGLQRGQQQRTQRKVEKQSGRFNADKTWNPWQDFPTQSPVCFRNDGLSERLDTETISFPKWRNESIKAAGNAVLPQIPFEIFKAIEQYENL